MSPYTLIVVDMQDVYMPSTNEHIRRVAEEITKAINAGAGIIFLEFWTKYFNGNTYNTKGQTIEELSDLVIGYKNFQMVKKFRCSGEMELCDFFYNNPGWNTNNLTICGVYTDQCVKATVVDLHQRLHHINIEIPMGACWTASCLYIKNKETYDYYLENNLNSIDNPFYGYPDNRITYK